MLAGYHCHLNDLILARGRDIFGALEYKVPLVILGRPGRLKVNQLFPASHSQTNELVAPPLESAINCHGRFANIVQGIPVNTRDEESKRAA